MAQGGASALFTEVETLAHAYPNNHETGGVCSFTNHTDAKAVSLALPAARSYLHVIGWPRSGSSLLSAILDGHPHASVANEFDTLSHFVAEEPATALATLPATVSALDLHRGDGAWKPDIRDGMQMRCCVDTGDCPTPVQIECAIAERTTTYRGENLVDKWAIAGTAQGSAHKFEQPLQVIGGKKVGRPWRRHAANPAVSWEIISTMNATLPPAKWVYLRRDPYNQICNCLIRKWCAHHGYDYYDDKPTWLAAAPLPLTGEDLTKCMDDFAVVALAAADLVPALPARGYGPVFPLSYEELCTQPEAALGRLCAFLGLSCSAQYVGAVAAFLRSNAPLGSNIVPRPNHHRHSE